MVGIVLFFRDRVDTFLSAAEAIVTEPSRRRQTKERRQIRQWIAGVLGRADGEPMTASDRGDRSDAAPTKNNVLR